MVDSIPAPKKHLALDTDWMSAAMAICALFGFGLLSAAMVWTMLQGKISAGSVTVWTPFFLASLIYFGIEYRDKLFRVAISIGAIGPVSRIVLWIGHASPQTRLANEIFVRCTEIGLFFGICIYLIYWLKTKVRHV